MTKTDLVLNHNENFTRQKWTFKEESVKVRRLRHLIVEYVLNFREKFKIISPCTPGISLLLL